MLDAVATDRIRESVMAPARRKLLWTDAPPADEELMAEIRARYKPEVVAGASGNTPAEELRHLWGYDKVD